MKKISLKNVKDTLSRKEMRTIAGGYGTTCTSCTRGSECGSTVCAYNQPNCPNTYACLI